jgi:hypothetical protein
LILLPPCKARSEKAFPANRAYFRGTGLPQTRFCFSNSIALLMLNFDSLESYQTKSHIYIPKFFSRFSRGSTNTPTQWLPAAGPSYSNAFRFVTSFLTNRFPQRP